MQGGRDSSEQISARRGVVVRSDTARGPRKKNRAKESSTSQNELSNKKRFPSKRRFPKKEELSNRKKRFPGTNGSKQAQPPVHALPLLRHVGVGLVPPLAVAHRRCALGAACEVRIGGLAAANLAG
eukprot:6213658-Pleurochrysis_carterae.AAC.2